MTPTPGPRRTTALEPTCYGLEILDRMVQAVEAVRNRLSRATIALDGAAIAYAVIGGNAVAAWVSAIDTVAVRNTRDVDLLIRRADLETATAPILAAGFHRLHVKSIEMFLQGSSRHTLGGSTGTGSAAKRRGLSPLSRRWSRKGPWMFLDGPNARARDAVHILFSGEKVRRDDLAPAPEVTDSQALGALRGINLPALVVMKLTSYRRDKDRTHLRDLLDVGLIDDRWLANLPEPRAGRLRHLIETPEG